MFGITMNILESQCSTVIFQKLNSIAHAKSWFWHTIVISNTHLKFKWQKINFTRLDF